MAHKHKQPVRRQVKVTQLFIVKLLASSLKLLLCQVGEIVAGFSDQLLGTHEGVNKQSSTTHHPWNPRASAVSSLVKLSIWETWLLQSSNSAPVSNVVELDSCHDDLKHTSAKVVGQKHIRVHLVNATDKGLEHLTLCFKQSYLAVSLLLQLLLQVKGPRFLIELANDRKLL